MKLDREALLKEAKAYLRQCAPYQRERLGAQLIEALLDEIERANALVSRTYPCGCVLCICEDDERCYGCGAKSCGKPDAECDCMQERIRSILSATTLSPSSVTEQVGQIEITPLAEDDFPVLYADMIVSRNQQMERAERAERALALAMGILETEAESLHVVSIWFKERQDSHGASTVAAKANNLKECITKINRVKEGKHG